MPESFLFRLPFEICNDIFSEWLNTIELVKVDSSWCQKSSRTIMLDGLKSKTVRGSVTNGSVSGLNWLFVREIQLKHLTVNCRLLGSIHLQTYAITTLERLESLSLSVGSAKINHEILSQAKEIIQLCCNLKSLEINYSHYSQWSIEYGLNSRILSSLTSLNLYCPLHEQDSLIISQSCRLLRHLDLGNEYLTLSYLVPICEIVEMNTNLESIRMSCHFCVVESIAKFCRKLKTAYTTRDISATVIAKLIANNVSENFIFRFEEEDIETTNMYDNYLKEPYGICCLKIAANAKVRRLSLRTNDYVDGLEDIFESFPNITEVAFQWVTEHQMETLLRYSSSTLQRIRLSNTLRSAFEVLLLFKNLTTLRVDENYFRHDYEYYTYGVDNFISIEEILCLLCNVQSTVFSELRIETKSSYNGSSLIKLLKSVPSLKKVNLRGQISNIEELIDHIGVDRCSLVSDSFVLLNLSKCIKLLKLAEIQTNTPKSSLTTFWRSRITMTMFKESAQGCQDRWRKCINRSKSRTVVWEETFTDNYVLPCFERNNCN